MSLPLPSRTLVPCVGAGLALALVVGPGVFSPPCPGHGDIAYYVQLARTHSLLDPQLFSHGQWPGGYPALLRIAIQHFGMHPIHVGRTLSLIAAGVALLSCMSVASSCVGGWASIATAVALLSNPLFLSVAAAEGTDMPAAGLITLGVALIAGGSPTTPPPFRRALAAGLTLGLAYMFRYTAMVALPVAIGAIALSRAGFRSAAALVLGFLLGALPQLVGSTLVRGNPFHNELARNSWLAMHEATHTAHQWSQSPHAVSLSDVIREDVAGFVAHWLCEARQFLAAGTGWPRGTIAFIAASCAAALLNRRIPAWRRFLLVALPLIATGATALAFFVPRHGLVPICGFGAVIGVAVETVREHLVERRRGPLGVALALAVVIIGGLGLVWSVRSFATRPTMRMIRTLHELMLDLGLTDVRQVASNHEGFMDTDSKWLRRYQTLEGHWSARSASELVTFPRRPEEVGFMVLDYHAYWGDFRAVREEVVRGGSPLAPLSREDSLEVYMVRPSGIGDAEADGIALAPGMLLAGHTWVWRGPRLTIYLYWTPDAPVADRYIVEVRLIGPGGTILASHAGEPELGTYPTTRWHEGEVVVDARILEVGPGVAQGDVEVCLVREADPWRACRRLWTVRRGDSTPLP